MNLRPPLPQSGALARLRHIPIFLLRCSSCCFLFLLPSVLQYWVSLFGLTTRIELFIEELLNVLEVLSMESLFNDADKVASVSSM